MVEKQCYDTGFEDFIKTPKKIIEIKVSFKGRWEIFMLKVKLFGFKWKDFKDLIKPKKLEVLFG